MAGFTVRISQLRDVLGKLSRQEFRKPPQGTLVPNSGKVTHSADGLIRFDEVGRGGEWDLCVRRVILTARMSQALFG